MPTPLRQISEAAVVEKEAAAVVAEVEKEAAAVVEKEAGAAVARVEVKVRIQKRARTRTMMAMTLTRTKKHQRCPRKRILRDEALLGPWQRISQALQFN